MRIPILFDLDKQFLVESLDLLFSRSKDKKHLNFVECGVAQGGTSALMIGHIKKKQAIQGFTFTYYGVDPGDRAFGKSLPLDKFESPEFKFVKGLTFQPEVLAQVPEEIDWLFIDACHCYNCVKEDAELYLPRLSAIGVAAFHDAAKAFQGQHKPQDYVGLIGHHDLAVAAEGIQVVRALNALDLDKLGVTLHRLAPLQAQGGVQIYSKKQPPIKFL